VSAPEPSISLSVGRSELGLKPNPTRAGIGGVSGGTGLVALAQAIGPTTPAGAIILYLSPAISFFIGIALYYLEAETSRYLERRLLNNARKTLEQQLDNPRFSNAYKSRIRKLLEELEEAVATSQVERVKLLTIPGRSTARLR
jgi:hypothetical protein